MVQNVTNATETLGVLKIHTTSVHDGIKFTRIHVFCQEKPAEVGNE